MSFAAPQILWLALGLLPALVLFFWWTWRQKQSALAQFVGSRLVSELVVGFSAARQWIKRGLLVAAVGTLLLALSRPVWGFTEEASRSSGLDIIVCFDVSKSMLAADLKPNRLQRAKLAVQDLLRIAPADRLGLVAFAGSAFLQCPLALDSESFRLTVQALDTETIPLPGTALAEALREAQLAFKGEGAGARAVVIFTDGEDHEPGAVERARECAADGIRIFTIGVGTVAGEVLTEPPDPFGNKRFLRDESGNPVKSALNETALKEVAEAGGGFYLPLQNAQTMNTLYQRGLAPMPKIASKGERFRQATERFQWPLAATLLLLLLEVVVPERARTRGGSQNPAGLNVKPA